MGRMKQVEVDIDRMTMVSEGGALWSDAQSIIKDKNVTFVGGGCPSVGIAGLVLGGGIGWTSRKRGLASDNVLSMEVKASHDFWNTCTKADCVMKPNENDEFSALQISIDF